MKSQKDNAAKVNRARALGGFMLIEVLVTILILTLGILGLAAMVGRAFSAEGEAYQRAQATAILDDLVDRISANRLTAPCFAQTFGPGATLVACATLSGNYAAGNTDLVIADYQSQLLGSMVTKGSNNVGGVTSARACVVQSDVFKKDPVTGLNTTTLEDLYYVAVAWQGLLETAAPSAPSGATAPLTSAVACGSGSYGASDALRRVIWTSIRIADLV